MYRHEETHTSPYSAPQLLALITDVERYPEFLPWCIAARILRRESEQCFFAELAIGYKHLRERYTSRVTVDEAAGTVLSEQTTGPFSHLRNFWQLTPLETGGTRIHLTLEFAFRSRLLNGVLNAFFTKACNAMNDAFRARADALYGPPLSSQHASP